MRGAFVNRLLYIYPRNTMIATLYFAKRAMQHVHVAHAATFNDSVGSRKTFKCTSGACDFIVDRDLNGARNIALKWLSNPLN